MRELTKTDFEGHRYCERCRSRENKMKLLKDTKGFEFLSCVCGAEYYPWKAKVEGGE